MEEEKRMKNDHEYTQTIRLSGSDGKENGPEEAGSFNQWKPAPGCLTKEKRRIP